MKKFRTIPLIVAPLVLVVALTGCTGSGQDTSMPGMDHGGMSTSPSAEVERAFNDADSMFAMMMIPHHEQAVEMSDMVLAKDDVDQRVLDLAQQIKNAQGPEIEVMKSWLTAWGMSGSAGMDGMDHSEGMMSEDDMSALDSATGAEASRLFLEQMIEHHEGAIEMAETELESGINPDAVALAKAIVETQTAEISAMRDLLTRT